LNKTKTLLISSALLPVIPMLFLYNHNSAYLSFWQVCIYCIFLILIVMLLNKLIRSIFKPTFPIHSELIAFIACLAFVCFVFAYDGIYDKILKYYINPYIFLLIAPAAAYIIAFLFSKIISKIKTTSYASIINVAVFVMVLMNVLPLFKVALQTENTEIKFKTNFTVNEKAYSPNVYWILCDGLLGFDAMEKYFNDSQSELIQKLQSRGFIINKSAMLESGHNTRIAVPALMCPNYYDIRLKTILDDHTSAMKAYSSLNLELSNTRYNNELINAFKEKGYTTISMSLDEDVFFPTTDYFYYVAAHYTSDEEYAQLPAIIENANVESEGFYQSRFRTEKLGQIFLGGLPSKIFDFVYGYNKQKKPLSTKCTFTSSVLANGENSGRYTVLIDSVYDALYSESILEPKFIIIHSLMAHYPFIFNENGGLNENTFSASAYKGHHTYAAKVLVNIIDMIVEKDPDAVIVLQADHGLHGLSEEQIDSWFGISSDPLDIWNNVFSAIQVPEKYENGEEIYAITNPLNISRYLVNSFVGKNYSYIEDGS